MRWKDGDLKYAKRLISEGYERKDVAEKMGVSSNALNKALRRFNLKEKQQNKKRVANV